jgi:hypothetical protein
MLFTIPVAVSKLSWHIASRCITPVNLVFGSDARDLNFGSGKRLIIKSESSLTRGILFSYLPITVPVIVTYRSQIFSVGLPFCVSLNK